MSTLEIFSANVCPFAQRSRIALIEKGLEFELTEVDLANKPDLFLDVSPYGKVPVIKHNDHIVYESTIINEYLEEVFPEPPLLPSEPYKKAMARIWISYCNEYLIPPFYRLLTSSDSSLQQELTEKLLETLRYMEREGLEKMSFGPFWLGPDITLVDITFYPFFERFCVLEHYRNFTIPENCRRLRQWYGEMCKRRSVQATANASDYYVKEYAKYAS